MNRTVALPWIATNEAGRDVLIAYCYGHRYLLKRRQIEGPANRRLGARKAGPPFDIGARQRCRAGRRNYQT
ncbi:hypothetical protein FQZ97_1015530 [compost metagenome]